MRFNRFPTYSLNISTRISPIFATTVQSFACKISARFKVVLAVTVAAIADVGATIKARPNMKLKYFIYLIRVVAANISSAAVITLEFNSYPR